MTARRRSRTGRTLVIAVGLCLAAAGCNSSSKSGATGPSPSANNNPTVVTSSAAPSTGGACTADSVGYPKITDFHGVKVGFSQSEPDNASFRAAETKSMRDEAKSQGADLLYANANKQADKQIADIKDLITKGAKLLIVAPLNSDGLQPAWDAAKAAKVPVVTVDRLVNQKACVDYLTFIGSNFVSQGKRAADAMIKATGGKANLVILLGSSGNGVTTDRTSGFVAEVKAAGPGIKILAQQTGDFDRATGQKVMAQLLQAHPEINAVYAENDEMGVGAWNAIKAAGKKPGKDVKIISIDGIKDAVSKIVAGTYNGVVQSNPRFGPLAFEQLKKFEDGTGVPPKVIIGDDEYTPENAKAKLGGAF